MNQVAAFDPFADVFPGLLRGFVAPGTRVVNGARPSQTLKARIDVAETDKTYVVYADLPGVSKDAIDVKIDGAQVSISATLASREAVEGETVLRSERYAGEMSRSFTLATELDEDAAVAKFENGVLELTLPKKQVAAARRLEIN